MRKLYFSYSKMTITEHKDSNEIIIQVNWDIELDVPEKMYNRTSENYRVISCSNENFEEYSFCMTKYDTTNTIKVMLNYYE